MSSLVGVGSPKGLSGWLRKRPTFAGFWPNRFVQLTEDGKLVIYTHDYSKAEADSNHLVVALYTVHIPQLVQIDPVYEHFVRTARAGIKSERVFVVRARFKNHVLFTLGAPTAAEASQWKAGLESAAAAAATLGRSESLDTGAVEEPVEAAPPPPPVFPTAAPPAKVRKSHSSMVPDNWKQNSAAVWKVVEERDGLTIEGTETSNQFPSLRAVCEVKGTAKDIFDLVMDHESMAFTTSRVVKRLNDTSDIVYMQTREISVGPVQAGPRDLVLLRYWRMDEEGDFVITWQSIEDSSVELKSPDGFCRGKIFSMSLHVVPNSSDVKTCAVRIHCHADPGGNMSYATQSMLTAWITPFVTGVLGIEPALDAKFRGSAPVALDTFEDNEDEEPVPSRQPDALPQQEELRCGSWRFEEWTQTPEDEPFNVRGKTYLTDRIKHPSKQHKFVLVAADLNTCDAPVHHCAARSDSPLTQIRERYPTRQVFVMQFIMPGPPFYVLSMYAVAREGVCEEDSPFARLWTNFVEGTDEFRNTMFKMIPRVTKGSFIVKKTVGQVPAILGTKVKLNYYTGPNYIEVDVDLNTSAVAGSILSVVKGYATTFVADLTLLLEGHSEDELPEEIIVGFRMIKPHLSKAVRLGADPNPELTKQRIAIAENSRTGELKKNGTTFQ